MYFTLPVGYIKCIKFISPDVFTCTENKLKVFRQLDPLGKLQCSQITLLDFGIKEMVEKR